MTGQPRYSSDSVNNGVLRAVLYSAWGYRCYWCRGWYDVAEIRIDHLIPQKYRFSHEALDEVLRELLSPEDLALGFDIDAAHNLAPICTNCNTEKSDTLFHKIPKFMKILLKARKLQPEVEKRFYAFYSRNDLANALLAVSAANVDDLAAKATLMEFGPLMVNRLRAVAPDVLAIPTSYEYFDPSIELSHRVVVTLDEAGRRASIILEDFYSQDLNDSLQAPIRAVELAIKEHMIAIIRNFHFDEGDPDPVIDDVSARMLIEVTALTFDPPAKNFELRGQFEADGAGDVALEDAANDSGTRWVQGNAEVVGTFHVPFWPGYDEECDASLSVSADSAY